MRCAFCTIGASDDCESLDINLLVDDVLRIINYLCDNVLGGRRVILIGHSVGGVIITFAVSRANSSRSSPLQYIVMNVLCNVASTVTF